MTIYFHRSMGFYSKRREAAVGEELRFLRAAHFFINSSPWLRPGYAFSKKVIGSPFRNGVINTKNILII